MARKPLLSSPVLNREEVQSRLAGDDLMSRVIENDAAKHGRSQSPTPPSAAADDMENLQVSNISVLQDSRSDENIESSQERSLESQTDDNLSDKQSSSQSRHQADMDENAEVEWPVMQGSALQPAQQLTGAVPDRAANQSSGSSRDERLAKIMNLAESDGMIVVSVRVPKRLNDYVDQYVSRAPKKDGKYRYLKQDALTEALAAFVVDHPMPAQEDLF